jgi:hypothetical protein
MDTQQAELRHLYREVVRDLQACFPDVHNYDVLIAQELAELEELPTEGILQLLREMSPHLVGKDAAQVQAYLTRVITEASHGPTRILGWGL